MGSSVRIQSGLLLMDVSIGCPVNPTVHDFRHEVTDGAEENEDGKTRNRQAYSNVQALRRRHHIACQKMLHLYDLPVTTPLFIACQEPVGVLDQESKSSVRGEIVSLLLSNGANPLQSCGGHRLMMPMQGLHSPQLLEVCVRCVIPMTRP